MQGSISGLKLDFEKRIITDPKQIKKYDLEFDYNFYSPKSEHDWIDTPLVLEHRYSSSRDILGTPLTPIYVAVNDKDDFIDDPTRRVHGRILDGRQRHADTKILNQRWPVKYVYVKDYWDYIMLWSSMGSKKSPEVDAAQTKAIIRNACDIVWQLKPKEIHDKSGDPQKDKVSKYVCDKFEKYWSPQTIRKYILPEFKEQYRIENSSKQSSTSEKKLSKTAIENKTLKNEISELHTKIAELEQRVLPKDKKDKVIKDNETKIKRMKIIIGNLKTELRKQRMSSGIIESDKEFEKYWSNFTLVSELYTT